MPAAEAIIEVLEEKGLFEEYLNHSSQVDQGEPFTGQRLRPY